MRFIFPASLYLILMVMGSAYAEDEFIIEKSSIDPIATMATCLGADYKHVKFKAVVKNVEADHSESKLFLKSFCPLRFLPLFKDQETKPKHINVYVSIKEDCFDHFEGNMKDAYLNKKVQIEGDASKADEETVAVKVCEPKYLTTLE